VYQLTKQGPLQNMEDEAFDTREQVLFESNRFGCIRVGCVNGLLEWISTSSAASFTPPPSPGMRMVLKWAEHGDGASYRMCSNRDWRQRGAGSLHVVSSVVYSGNHVQGASGKIEGCRYA
jgi:hypothetical protein